MSLEPARVERAADEVARSLRVDPRLMKRLSNYGPPVHIFRVSWNNKDAGIAIVDDSVVLAAAGLTGGVSVGQYAHCALTLTGSRTARLRLFGETHAVTFTSEEEAAFCQAEIDARNQARRIQLGDVEPLALREGERLVRDCTFVGGAYLPLLHQSLVDLVFRHDGLEIYRSPSSPESDVVASVPFSPTFSLDVGGPGRVTRGGGFVGGGSSLVSIVEGRAIASFLNSLTTRTTIVTLIAVGDDTCEGFFVTSQGEPGVIRQHLSPVFVRLRQQQPDPQPAPVPLAAPATDLVSQIERLAALHLAGALTDTEFVEAKAALIRGS